MRRHAYLALGGLVAAGMTGCRDDDLPDGPTFDALGFGSSQGSSTCAPPVPHPTAWWRGNGSAADVVGGQHAVLRGDATFGAGLVQQAFVFDGDGDFVEVPHDPALDFGTRDFGIGLWVRFNSTEGEQILAEKYIERFDASISQGWTLTKPEGNGLVLAMADGSGGETGVASDVLTIPVGTWIHFAATRRNGVVTLYMNGVPLAEGDAPISLNSPSSLKFGHRGNSFDTPGSLDESGFFLNGAVDEVELFVGVAPTQQQIQAIIDAGSAGRCSAQPQPRLNCVPPVPGVTGWWRGNGTTDDVVGGRDATLRGDATFGPGLVQQAFLLDGDGDFVDVPHDPALDLGTGDFTIGLWVMFNSTEGEQILAEKYIERFDASISEGWTLTKLDGNVLLLAMFDGSGGEANVASDVLTIPVGTWIHFAATRRNGLVTLYLNGGLVAWGDAPISLNSASSLKFGHRGDPFDTPGSEDDRGFFLNGSVDEVELFVGTALTQRQILAIVRAGSGGRCRLHGR